MVSIILGIIGFFIALRLVFLLLEGGAWVYEKLKNLVEKIWESLIK